MLRERKEAEAAEKLARAGNTYKDLKERTRLARRELKPLVLQALARGVTFRRAAKLAGLNTDIVNTWHKQETRNN